MLQDGHTYICLIHALRRIAQICAILIPGFKSTLARDYPTSLHFKNRPNVALILAMVVAKMEYSPVKHESKETNEALIVLNQITNPPESELRLAAPLQDLKLWTFRSLSNSHSFKLETEAKPFCVPNTKHPYHQYSPLPEGMPNRCKWKRVPIAVVVNC